MAAVVARELGALPGVSSKGWFGILSRLASDSAARSKLLSLRRACRRLKGKDTLQLLDKLKSMLGSTPERTAAPAPMAGKARQGTPFVRHSSGLEQFFSSMKGQYALNLLDFAGASQANISYITNLGHRISSEDYLRSLELTFGEDEQFYERQDDEELLAKFLDENLKFPPQSFDGVLVWDALQFLSPTLLNITVERLATILRPKASMLAFFHADEKAQEVPLYSYRIQDEKNLLLTSRGTRKRAQFFNNRGLEKLFAGQTVKFFLTRDSLREIIVRR